MKSIRIILLAVLAMPVKSVAQEYPDNLEVPSMVYLFPADLFVLAEEIRQECKKKHWDENLRKQRERAEKSYFQSREQLIKEYREKFGKVIRDIRELESDERYVAALNKKRNASNAFQQMEYDFYSCQQKGMAALKLVLDVFQRPSESSTRIGQILLKFHEETGLPAYAFIPANADSTIPFSLDTFDGDWGYSLAYHTVLATSGNWVKLPKNPFPDAVWVNLEPFGKPKIKSLFDLGIVNIETERYSGAVIFTRLENGRILARKETQGDKDCAGQYSEQQREEMRREAMQPQNILDFEFEELFSAEMHLRVDVKYKRGC